MAFRVGQKVVCVNDTDQPAYAKKVKLDGIYVVRSIADFPEGCGLRLKGIRNRHPFDKVEPAYHVWRFRPLVDISDLEAIVAEQLKGKPRTIKPDKFDRKRVHSAAHPLQRDAAFPSAAAPEASPSSGAPTPRASPLPSLTGDANSAAGASQ